MGLKRVVLGPNGEVLKFIRASGRCPADDFEGLCLRGMWARFLGSFGGLVQTGARFMNPQRFKPLTGEGKPLWEFKEHDHRLYCVRSVEGGKVRAVLLNGWIKEKEGRSRQEDREIERAKRLMKEYLDGPKGEKK